MHPKPGESTVAPRSLSAVRASSGLCAAAALDADGIFRSVTPAFADLTGLPAAELIGHPIGKVQTWFVDTDPSRILEEARRAATYSFDVGEVTLQFARSTTDDELLVVAIPPAIELSRLAELTKLLRSAIASNGTEGTVNRVLEGLNALVHGDGVVIESEQDDHLTYEYVYGIAEGTLGLQLPKNASLSGYALQQDAVFACGDTTLDPRVDQAAARRVSARSLILTRILYDDGSRGVLKVLSRRPHAFTKADEEIVAFAATFLTVVIGRIRSERALRASERRLRDLVQANPVGMLLGDIYGNVHDCNAAFAMMLGRTRNEIVPAFDWVRATPPEWHAIDQQKIEEQTRFGIVEPYEKEFIRADGTRVPVLIAFALVGETRELSACYALDLTSLRAAESARYESEFRFRALADSITQLAWIAGPDGGLTWVNRRLLEYTGKSVEELIDWKWKTVHHPDYVDGVVARFSAAIATGGSWEDTFPVLGADGQYRWFLSRAVPINDADGNVLMWFGTNTDVTELREAQDRLVTLQKRYELGLRAAKGLVYDWDIESNQVNRVGDLAALIGISTETADTGADWWLQRIHPDDLAAVREHGERMFAGQTAEREVQYRVRHADGSYVWVSDRSQMERDEEGNVVRIFGQTVDITDRRKMSDALAASEELYRTTTELVPQIVTIHGPNGEIEWANAEWTRYFGSPPGTFEQRVELVHPEDRERTGRHWRLCVDEGVPFQGEYRLRRHDGEYRWFHGRIRPLFDAVGKRYRWVGSLTDVHDQKEMASELELRVRERTKQLEMANRELEGFVYSIAHDVRAPLRAIIATSRIISEDLSDTLGDEQRALLSRQEANSAKLAELIDGLLRYARLGRETLTRVPINLTALAQEVAVAVSRSMPDREVDFEVAPGLVAEGDASAVRILLENLMSNATKFSPNGGTIRVGQTEQGFFVQDGGIGFDMAYHDKLFMPFERLHRDVEYPGTGIGLANVARVAERHGGRAWAESEPGCGATFWFTLQ